MRGRHTCAQPRWRRSRGGRARPAARATRRQAWQQQTHRQTHPEQGAASPGPGSSSAKRMRGTDRCGCPKARAPMAAQPLAAAPAPQCRPQWPQCRVAAVQAPVAAEQAPVAAVQAPVAAEQAPVAAEQAPVAAAAPAGPNLQAALHDRQRRAPPPAPLALRHQRRPSPAHGARRQALALAQRVAAGRLRRQRRRPGAWLLANGGC
jgi:hypothetical protein